MKRVVVTGMAGIRSLGHHWKGVREALLAGRSGVVLCEDWVWLDGLATQLAAPVQGFTNPETWRRKKRRSVGCGSAMAVRATELALDDAALAGSPELSDGSTGIACASTGMLDARESGPRRRPEGTLWRHGRARARATERRVISVTWKREVALKPRSR